MIKSDVKICTKNHLHYIVKNGKKSNFKPWLGDSFSFLYDFIMKRSIFPKKFGGDISKHYEILSRELENIHGKRVLELATGSGSAVNFLPNDNTYTGTDISPGLLRKALMKLRNNGFKDAQLYVASGDNLPFEDKYFDFVLCILSLNFFNDVKKVFQEIRRVSEKDAAFICSVPVPERNTIQNTIRGTLYSEEELEKICQNNGFKYESIPAKNGALLYFRAILQ